MAFRAWHVESGRMLSVDHSERLLDTAVRSGRRLKGPFGVARQAAVAECVRSCEEQTRQDVGARFEGFEEENRSAVDQMLDAVERWRSRRSTELGGRLAERVEELVSAEASAVRIAGFYGDSSQEAAEAAKVFERAKRREAAARGFLTRVERQATVRRAQLAEMREIRDVDFVEVAAGVIVVRGRTNEQERAVQGEARPAGPGR